MYTMYVCNASVSEHATKELTLSLEKSKQAVGDLIFYLHIVLYPDGLFTWGDDLIGHSEMAVALLIPV